MSQVPRQRTYTKGFLLALALLAILITPVTAGTERAYGLLCASETLPPAERIKQSDYVFTGTVKGGTPVGDENGSLDPANIVVDTVVKGNIPPKTTVSLTQSWEPMGLKDGSKHLFLFKAESYDPPSNIFTRQQCDDQAVVALSSDDFGGYRDLVRQKDDSSAITPVIVVLVLIPVTLGAILITRRKRKQK